ncbi:Nn.00g019340.m01.CDS01 [Neocucurbitaria sp. VM-36]
MPPASRTCGATVEDAASHSPQADAPSEYGLDDSHFQLPLRQLSTRLGESNTSGATNTDQDEIFVELRVDFNDGSTDGSWEDCLTPDAQTLDEVEPDEPEEQLPAEPIQPTTTDDVKAFYAAIRRGDAELMKAKLDVGVDIDRETDDGITALVISIMEEKIDITKLLLEQGADVHHRVSTLPPIVHAVMRNDCGPQLIQLLINHGANPNSISGPEQMNALHWAAVDGMVDALDFLISKGMDLNSTCSKGRTPLILAAENGHITVAKVLLAKGAELFRRSQNGGTALAWAACNGRLDTVKYLLEEGVDVDDCDDCGLTALSIASNSGHLEVVEFLIEKGADVNSLSVEPKHFTPAMAAVMRGHTEVIRALTRHKADLNILNGNGETVLEVAVTQGHFEIVHVLLEALGGPNHPRDSVALQMAMADSHATIKSLIATASIMYLHFTNTSIGPGKFAWMSWVLDSGGPLVKPRAMSQMMHAALIQEQQDMIKALLGHGCNPDAYIPSGHTPLSFAIERQNLEIVRVLLDAGADPARPGRDPHSLHSTPLHQALVALEADKEKDTSIVDLLLSSGRCKLLTGKRLQHTAFSYIVRQFSNWDNGLAEILAFRMLESVPDVAKERCYDGSTLMHIAVHYDRRDLINILIQKGVDINTPNVRGHTPFLKKCQRRARNLHFLLERGADVFVKDKQGQSALHIAAIHGSIDTMELLLSKGLDIDAVTVDGDTPLICALVVGQEQAALYLIDHGADTTARCYTMERCPVQSPPNRRTERVAVEKAPTFPECKDATTTTKSPKGWTQLALACRIGSIPLVRTLLASGLDPEATQDDLDRPLHIALISSHDALALHLITHAGVDVHARGSRNRTPLHLAAEYRNPRSAALLISRGASTHDVDDELCTPLCVCNDAGITRLLVENGAELDYRDPWGWTPAHWAVERRSVGAFRVLVASGADVMARTEDDGLSVVERIEGIADERVRWRFLDVLEEEKERGVEEVVLEGER